MFNLAMAVSYAPGMYRAVSEWPMLHAWAAGEIPQPREYAAETDEVRQDQVRRIEAAFETLRGQLQTHRIEALVVLATDNGRLYSNVQVPQLSTFLGAELWGSTQFAELGEPAAGEIVRIKCDSELASFIQEELVWKGFDMSYSKSLRPMAQPEYGAAPAFFEPVRRLVPDLGIPIVPIHVNANRPPAPSGRRMYRFGQALGEILAEWKGRVAVLASGGLSHDHGGPRGGWIDEPMDRFVLERYRRGRSADLQSMFDVVSDTLVGGGAQIRLWNAAAAAAESQGVKASILDYIPSFSLAAGVGFAYWPVGAVPPEEVEPTAPAPTLQLGQDRFN
jgi:hypothetical protein